MEMDLASCVSQSATLAAAARRRRVALVNAPRRRLPGKLPATTIIITIIIITIITIIIIIIIIIITITNINQFTNKKKTK